MLSQSNTIKLGRAALAADLAADRVGHKGPDTSIRALPLRRLAQIRGWKHIPQEVLAPYRERDAILKDLGFENYRAYLASPLWLAIRAQVLSDAGYKCRSCSQKAVNVHHLSYDYDTIYGTQKGIKQLVALCRDCHSKAEINEEGQKVSLSEANSRIKYKAKRTCVCCRKDKPLRNYGSLQDLKVCKACRKRYGRSTLRAHNTKLKLIRLACQTALDRVES